MADTHRHHACRVLSCTAAVAGLREVNALQLDAMLALHRRAGHEVDADEGPVCFCSKHHSSAAALIGELVAEAPAEAAQGGGHLRVGRVDPASLELLLSAPAPGLPFNERFCADSDGMRYVVRWYGADGGTPWLDGELPPAGAPTSVLEPEAVLRGLELFDEAARAPGERVDRSARPLGWAVFNFFYFNPRSALARAGLLSFQLLVLAVAAVCLWSIWLSTARADLHLSASLSAGAIAVLATAIAMLEIVSHLRNVHSPELQTYVVRILLIVPVFAVCCWLSLRFANSAPALSHVCDAVRHVYEAFVVHTFFNLLTACFGTHGSEHLCRVLAAKPQQQHLFGLRHVLAPPKMGEPFLTFCRFGTLQFVSVKSACALAELALRSSSGRRESAQFSPRQPYLYLLVAINGSQLAALYSLALFYHTLHADLAPIRPLGKFLSVKMIVFFTFWQGIAISLAVRAGLITGTSTWGVRHISSALNNYLLCVEMLVAACVHTHVFSHKDFIQQQLVQEARRLRRFDSMLIEVVDPSRLLLDTRDMLAHCLCRARCCFAKAAPAPDGQRVRPAATWPGLRASPAAHGGAPLSRASTLGYIRSPRSAGSPCGSGSAPAEAPRRAGTPPGRGSAGPGAGGVPDASADWGGTPAAAGAAHAPAARTPTTDGRPSRAQDFKPGQLV